MPFQFHVLSIQPVTCLVKEVSFCLKVGTHICLKFLVQLIQNMISQM